MAEKDVSFLQSVSLPSFLNNSSCVTGQPLEYQFQTTTHLQTLLSLEGQVSRKPGKVNYELYQSGNSIWFLTCKKVFFLTLSSPPKLVFFKYNLVLLLLSKRKYFKRSTLEIKKFFKFTFGLCQQVFPQAVCQQAIGAVQFVQGSLPFFRPTVDEKRRVI